MPTVACVRSKVPGRLRLGIPSRKGDTAYWNSLQAACAKLPGVANCLANALTGSLLLTSHPGITLSPEKVAVQLDLQLQSIDPVPWDEKISNYFEFVDRHVKHLTRGELDLKGGVFLGCIAAGIYQIGIGNLAMPAWFVAFWYAMNLAGGKGHKPSH